MEPIKIVKMILAGRASLDANVRVIKRDALGRQVKLWQDSKLAMKLLKRGWISPLWLNEWRGKWFMPLVQPFLGYYAFEGDAPNLIPNAGLAALMKAAANLGGLNGPCAIGIGTGTTALNAVSDTTLEGEVKADGTAAGGTHALDAAHVMKSSVTITTTDDGIQLVGTITFAAAIAVTKYGLFDADTNGNMIAEQLKSVSNMSIGETMQIIWTLKGVYVAP